ncbi:hypothetical protein [Nodosilinea nodulosa]|uniref:hypothetical protein n=1 Tax=Nodosilinea nodulosa TaxID=416001 RepID=UPI0002DC4066|nr:hypothetical protein [Nodosilinea nodulosa]
MKFNHRAAQRDRQPQPHTIRYQLGSSFPTFSSSGVPSDSSAGDQPADPGGGRFSKLRQKISAWYAHRLEPRITPITDRSGNTWWQVYDPRTHQQKWLASQDEVMLWLDNEAWF